MSNYDPDSPISSHKKDIFGREEYAKKVAKVVKGLPRGESYVIGLYSQWGYGKTSTINLVKKNLGNKASLRHIDLEPWNYLSEKELAASLFYKITDKLEVQLTTAESAKKGFRRLLSKANKTSEALSGSGVTGKVEGVDMSVNYGAAFNAIYKISDLLSSPSEYNKQKERIEVALRKKRSKIVVFIDDIDRLDPTQILNVFKLVRSIANIKGITYILPFDESIVTESISSLLPGEDSGKNYIDKIIQIPLVLPLIEREQLDNFMGQKLDETLQHNEVEVFDYQQEDFSNFYRKINHKIDTPRSIIRAANSLRFAVPLLKGEVDIMDLISIELVRILYPELYAIARHNRSLLTNEYYHLDSPTDDQLETTKQQLSIVFRNNEEWLSVLAEIFPTVKKVYYGISIDEDMDINRKRKRIKSHQYFNKYFTYSSGYNNVSDVVYEESIRQPELSESDLDELLKLNPSSSLQKIGDSLELVTDPVEFSKNLILSVEKISDQPESFLSRSLVEEALRVVGKLTSSRDDVSKVDAYKAILSSARQPETVVYAIRDMDLSDEEYQKKNNGEESKDFQDFKKYAIKLIEEKIKNNSIAVCDLGKVTHHIFSYLQKYTNDNTLINNYVNKNIKTADDAVDFITQLLPTWSSLGSKSNKSFYSDLLERGTATYDYWFKGERFDPSFIYRMITSEKSYAKYKGIEQDNLEHFERRDIESRTLNAVGNEQDSNFRRIIAQQFIYLYEQSTVQKK